MHGQDQKEAVRLAAGPDDYRRFGLEKGHIRAWEDGLRLDTGDRKVVEHCEELGSFEECYWQYTIHGEK